MKIYIASCSTRGHANIYAENTETLMFTLKEHFRNSAPRNHSENCTMLFSRVEGTPVTLQYVPEKTVPAYLNEPE